VYGPTETTVWSTIKNITNESKVTIGKPIGNTTVYIFNDRIEETDDEEMGEICIGGDGVARGYYKDEKLTQEKFINKNNIGRIYKTGDLGKRLKTGDIEFHGRRDMQVKINGYRIELGEIENSIRLNPHIKDVVIFMSEMNSGNKAIIAHLIKKDATPDDKYESDDEIIEKLSNELKRILPSYMIPSVFEIVDKFPLTPNGKIDRNAIKNSFKKPSIEVELTPPGSMTEKILHSIWCEELGKGMQNIGIHENFFRIGGSSLAAISISTEIRKKLKKNCSARQIFENPTIASLSKKIENNEEYGSVKKVEIKEMNGSENIPLSQTNFMFWFVESMLKMPVGPVNQIYQIDGKFDIPKFEKAVNTICSSHESIWCTFSSIRPLVKMNRPGKITIHNDDISDIEASLKEKYMENLYKKEFYTPFTYNKGPLIRISIITIEKTKHTLLVSLPHMICDDGSLNAITMEIFKEYSNDVHAHSNGREAKKYSLKEMIRDQKEFMNSEKFEKGLQFYREKLKGFKFLSIDKSFLVSKLKRSNKKIIESISLSKEMMSQISEISIKTETTPQEVILSIVFASLRKFYEVNDILLYMPVDLSGIYPSPKMVNFFVGSIPVRIVINSNATYKKLLLTIKSYLMETFDHLLVLDSNIAGIGTDMIELKKTTFRIAKMILLQAMKLLLGKRHVNPKIIDYGVSCMLAEFEVKGNVKKQNPNRVYSSPFYFNVLPEFYKDTVLLKTDSIKVSYSHNFNVIVNPRAFEENNSSMEGRNKNIFLTKNEEGQATLYLCGGGLNAEAYSYLKKIMGQQLLQMLTNIDGTIIS
jgi:acyl carrier protein